MLRKEKGIISYCQYYQNGGLREPIKYLAAALSENLSFKIKEMKNGN